MSLRQTARLDAELARLQTRVQETQAILQHEAAALAREPDVVEGTRVGDWATLTRGAPRARTQALLRVADVVLVLGAGGTVIARVPETPPLTPPLLTGVSAPTARVVPLDRELYVLGIAPIGGDAATGIAVVGRRAGPLVASELGAFALFVVSGDHLAVTTLGAAPPAGWSAAAAGGARDIDGVDWRLRPAGRVGDDLVLAGASEAGARAERRRLAALLGAGLPVLLGLVWALRWALRPRPARARANVRLETLYSAAVALASEPELEPATTRALGIVCAVARIDAALLYRADVGAKRLVLVASHGVAGARSLLESRHLHGTRLGDVVRTGRHQVMDLTGDHLEDAALRSTVPGGYSSQLALPVPVDGVPWGVLTLVTRRRRRFDGDGLVLLQAVTHQIGLAVRRAAMARESRAKARRLEMLTRVAQRLTATLAPGELLQRTVEAAREIFDARMARLWLLEDDGVTLVLRAAAGVDAGVSRLALGEGLIGRVAAERTPLVVADIHSDPRAANAAVIRAEGLRAFAGVPLLIGDRLLGGLAIATDHAHEYGADDVDLLVSLANQAAVALDNARLLADEQARRRHLAALLEINTKIGGLVSTEQLLTSIAEEAARLLGVDNAGFRVVDGDELVVAGLAGTAAQTMLRPRLKIGESLSGRVVATGRTLVVPIADAADIIPEHAAADRTLGYTTYLGVPLRVGVRTIGALTFRGRREFTARDQELAETFAGQAAIAIEHAGLYQEATRRAERMRALAEVSRLLAGTLEPDLLAERIVASVRRLFGVRSSTLFRLDDATGDLVSVVTASDGGPIGPVVFPCGVGAAGIAVLTRRPVASPDVVGDPQITLTPEVRDWVEQAGRLATLALPLVINDTVVGALSVGDAPGRVFDDEEVQVAQAFADQSALALANARLYAQATRRRTEAEELARLARTLTESLDVAAVAERTAQSLLPLFAAQSSVLRMLQPDGSLVALAIGGRLRDHLEPGHVQPRGIGLMGRAVAEERAVSTLDILDSPDAPLPPALRASMEEAGDAAVLAVPLRAKTAVIGALAVCDRRGRAFTEEEAALLQAFADQASLALDNARLYQEARAYADRLRALERVNRLVSSSLNVEEVLANLARAIADFFDAPYVSVWRLEAETGRLRRALAHGDVALAAELHDELAVGEGAVGRVVQDRAPILWTDMRDDARYVDAPALARRGLVWLTAYPIAIGDRILGAFAAHRTAPWAATPETESLMGSLAAQAAVALENARVYAESQERLRETSTLLAVGRLLSAPDAGDDVMRRVAGEVARAFGADMAGAYLLDERRERLFPVGGWHVPKDLLESLMTRPIVVARFPWLADAWSSGRAIWSGDVLHDDRFDPEWTGNLPDHSVLFVPTMSHGAPVGGLFLVWWRTGRVFSPAEVRLIEGVASQVGLAMENADLTRQTRAKLAETETLLSASRALGSTLDVQGLVRHFLRSVAATIGADCVGAWMVQEDGEWLEPLAGFRIPRARLETFRRFRVSLLKHAFYAEAARTRRAIYTTDAMQDPRIPAFIRDPGPHRTQLFVPVIVKDRMIAGFAALWWEEAREFTPSELALMEALASQAGVALENARLFAENRRRVEELSVLHDLSRAVTGQLDRTALIGAVRAQLARVLNAENMVIILRDEERGDLEVAIRVAGGVEDVAPPRRFPSGECGLVSIVLGRGRPVRTDDYAAACEYYGVAPVTTSAGLRHWLGAPMIAGERTLGAIVVRGGERPFTEADERLLVNIAHLVALAMSSARLYEERMRAFGELGAAQDQLVRTEKLRALGEMASGVAHDFNNLLASILGRAQLLLRRVKEPQQLQWLQVIERAALDGAQTVKRLQDFTRIRRDQPLRPLDPSDVVRDALEITQSRWQEEPLSRGVTIEVRTALPAVPPILGDAGELREVFTNLILNAVDAMPQGGALTLTTAEVDGQVVATVADTGTGIPDGVREKIFDPFFTTKGPQGTGLGLSMTYGIVSRHGGTIAVDSQPGRGTTFRLSFPRAVGATLAAAPSAAGDGAPVRSLRCLLVDDEPSVRTVLADILAGAGHEVVEVGDGATAIERFRAERFDVVLTDLAMPRVSGWQVARAVKHTAPGVPVFLVTGFGVELSADERRANGVDAVLVKPLQIQEVLDAVAGVARPRPDGSSEER